MWTKVRNWFLATVLFLGSVAAVVTFRMRRRADKALARINDDKIDDAGRAERQKMNAGELARLREEIAHVPAKSPDRTQEQVDNELRRRGHIK